MAPPHPAIADASNERPVTETSAAVRQIRMAVALVVSPLIGSIAIYPIVGGIADCAFFVAYLVAGVIGMPLCLWLAGRDAKWWKYTLAGLFVGAGPFVLLQGPGLVTSYRLHPPTLRPSLGFWIYFWRTVRLATGGATCGAISATLIWLVGFRQT